MTTHDIQTLTKQPGDNRLYDMEFAGLLVQDDTLASVSSLTVSPDPTSPALTVGSATVSGTRAQFRISGGKAEVRYKITLVVLTVGGDTLEGEGYLFVTAI